MSLDLDNPIVTLTDLVAVLAEPEHGHGLAQLRAALDAQTVVEHLVDLHVAEARRRGAAWSDIGALTGISKQGAQQRYSR